jgi:hypothetical protein
MRVSRILRQLETSNIHGQYIYIYINKGVHLQSKLQSTGTSSAADNSPVAYVIAQQFSSASFFLMCFHFHNEKFHTTFKNVVVSILLPLKLLL